MHYNQAMKFHEIEIDEARLAKVCIVYRVRELQLFGSVTRGDFSPASDVDIVVRFLPDRRPSLFSFAGLELDLTELLGRQVHLHTDAMIPQALKSRVLKTAQVAYAA